MTLYLRAVDKRIVCDRKVKINIFVIDLSTGSYFAKYLRLAN